MPATAAGDDPKLAEAARAAQNEDKAVWEVVDEFLEADRPLSAAQALLDAVQTAGQEQVLDSLRDQVGLSQDWRVDMVAEMRADMEQESKKIATDMGLDSLLTWNEIRAITGFDIEEVFDQLAEPGKKDSEEQD